MKWMERNEGEVVRRRIERKEGERQRAGMRGRRERGSKKRRGRREIRREEEEGGRGVGRMTERKEGER
jgi:hypothetical protein